MSYGFRIVGADGVLRLDSDSLPSMLKDTIALTKGVSGSRNYPDIVGYTLTKTQIPALNFPTGLHGDASYNAVTISYPGGIPTIAWNNGGNFDSYLFVFAK